MSRDKQIEKMCEVLRENAVSCKTCNLYAEGFCYGNCELAEDNQTVCEALYNAGYRKATDVAEEIFAEIEKFTYRYLNDADYSGGDLIYDIAELKKKYTEGENDYK